MVTVPVFTQREVAPQPVRPSAATPSTPGASAAFGVIGARDIAANGELIQRIAQEEFELIVKRDTNRMLADLADFEIESQARLIQFEQSGTGDKPFVESVMADYEERSKNFIDAQPVYVKDELRLRLLPNQVQYAKTALALQNQRVETEFLQNSARFTNSLANKVLTGQVDRATALAQAENFTRTLPANLQAKQAQILTESVISASVFQDYQQSSATEQGLLDFISRAESGEYNDVNTNQLTSLLNRAQSDLTQLRTQQIAVQNKIADNIIKGDTASAARLHLQNVEGNSAPTIDDILRVQKEDLGIPSGNVSILTEDQAKTIGQTLRGAGSIEEFIALRDEQIFSTAEYHSEAREIFVKDLQKKGGMSDAFNLALNIGSVPQTNPEYATAVFTLAKNPDAGEQAIQNIKDSLPPASRSSWEAKFEQAIQEITQFDRAAMARSGASFDAINQRVETLRGINAIILQTQATASDAELHPSRIDVTKLEEYRDVTSGIVRRTHNGNSYVLPQSFDAAISESFMEDLKAEAVEDIALPQVVRNASEGDQRDIRRVLRRDSAWTNEGSSSVKLIDKSTGRPRVRVDGTPIVYTFDRLQERVLNDPPARTGGVPFVSGTRRILGILGNDSP